MSAQRSLIADVESAIASGSSQKRVDTLRRVTDLFMLAADDYADDQVEIFDDVIARLADQIETKARAELAQRLAPVRNAPIEVMRALARDDAIEVAGPVLSQSSRLTDEDLLAHARNSSQERLLAISKRATVSAAVSDVLVERGDQDVVRSVAGNEGARFSDAGFGRLVERSIADEALAISVGMRKDIPKAHLNALVAKASEAVFKKLAAANPGALGEVNRVLSDITGRAGMPKPAPAPKVKRDYTDAREVFEALQRSGAPIGAAVQGFAKAGKFEETVVALSTLCHLPIDAVENVLNDKRPENDLVLILARAAGVSWATAREICVLRRPEMATSPQSIETAHQHFERLQVVTAQRVVRFYQVRHAGTGKPV